MTDRLGREDQGIEIDLLEVFRRLLLERDSGVATLGTDQAGMIRTIGVGREVPAAMRGDHFQSRKTIERALENKMRERDRRLQRIADGIGEPAITGQSLLEF